MKECLKCMVAKPDDAFYAKSNGKPWATCKVCTQKAIREGRQKRRIKDYKYYLDQQGLYDYYKRTLKYQ